MVHLSRRFMLAALLTYPPAAALAALPVAAGERFEPVRTVLRAKGYTVYDAGYEPLLNGTLDPASIFVKLLAASQNYDAVFKTQVLDGFAALIAYQPHVPQLRVYLVYQHYLIIFVTETVRFKAYADRQADPAAYWSYLEARLTVYDTQAKRYVTSGDFINKQFGQSGTSGSSTNSGSSVIVFLPSSLFLPAGVQGEHLLSAALYDMQGIPVVNERVIFLLERTGRDPVQLGTAATSTTGTATLAFTSPQNGGSITLRAFSGNTSTARDVLVGAAPPDSDLTGQAATITTALERQGYSFIPVTEDPAAPPVLVQQQRIAQGYDIYYTIMVMPRSGQSFDRSAYTQLFLALGTAVTVQPRLVTALIYLAFTYEGGTYYARYRLSADHFRRWRAAEIDEAAFWARQEPPALLDRNWQPLNDKNFVTKIFTPGSGQGTQIITRTRTVTARRVREAWGIQNYYGHIRIGIGAAASRFSVVTEGQLSGWQIVNIYDAATPLFDWKPGDDPDSTRRKLAELQLGQGTYFVVAHGSPPAVVMLTYRETARY